MDQLKVFIDALANEAGISTLPEEIQERQKDMMQANLHQRLGLAVMSNLDPKSQEEYVEMITKNPDGKGVQEFLNEKIPNFSKLFENTIDDYGREFLSAFKK